MAQATRRSPRYLAARQAVRRLPAALREFAWAVARDGIPRTREDWAAFIGLAGWFAIIGVVFARWWGGA